MTQTAQETETFEQVEEQLWDRYVMAKTLQQKAWLNYEKLWRKYITTGLRDVTVRDEWYSSRDVNDACREVADAAFKEWQRVAYPMYDLPLDDEEDE